MSPKRRTAVVVGVLYIAGTVTAILSVVLTQPALNAPDYLSQVAASETAFVLGVLLWIVMSLALAMVPVMLFPILRNHNEVLALGYVVFRGALEPVMGILMAVSRLSLVLVSQAYVAAGTPGDSYFQSLGALAYHTHDAINPILIIVFSLDALMLYTMFYQSRLVPRWISVWGFIAILLHLATAFLLVFHLVRPDDTTTLMTINFPILVQEMVMAVWLIVRGFNPSAVTTKPVETHVTHPGQRQLGGNI